MPIYTLDIHIRWTQNLHDFRILGSQLYEVRSLQVSQNKLILAQKNQSTHSENIYIRYKLVLDIPRHQLGYWSQQGMKLYNQWMVPIDADWAKNVVVCIGIYHQHYYISLQKGEKNTTILFPLYVQEINIWVAYDSLRYHFHRISWFGLLCRF